MFHQFSGLGLLERSPTMILRAEFFMKFNQMERGSRSTELLPGTAICTDPGERAEPREMTAFSPFPCPVTSDDLCTLIEWGTEAGWQGTAQGWQPTLTIISVLAPKCYKSLQYMSHIRQNVRNTLTSILFGLVLRYYSARFSFNWHTELKCVKLCSCSDTLAVPFGRWFVLSQKLLEGDSNNALVFTA